MIIFHSVFLIDKVLVICYLFYQQCFKAIIRQFSTLYLFPNYKKGNLPKLYTTWFLPQRSVRDKVGRMAEWFKAHAWKVCLPSGYRGFESPFFRQLSLLRASAGRPVFNYIPNLFGGSAP